MQYVGIAVGYILGGQAIRLYVDFDALPSERYTDLFYSYLEADGT